MILDIHGKSHLTYCTNIHPGQSLEQVKANIAGHVLEVKRKVSPDQPFGLGLWLSAQAVDQLTQGDNTQKFKMLLDEHDLYVFTLNGFPYGDFHGSAIKENVYQPDWLDNSRLAYTERLASVMSQLMPNEEYAEGSISTLPGAFRQRIKTKSDITAVAERLVRCAASLHYISEQYGKVIRLALEPEPFCMLESILDAVKFFRDHLFSQRMVLEMAKITGLDRGAADKAIRNHLGICYDACHFAVGFEDPKRSLLKLQAEGIRINKVQVSAGLEVPDVDAFALAELEPFMDDVYLHQVTQKSGNEVKRFLDLPEAIEEAKKDPDRQRHWRVHFHVPLYQEKLGPFVNTRGFLDELLPLLVKSDVRHYEVETYTWEVLPEQYRWMKVEGAIARELEWARERLIR